LVWVAICQNSQDAKFFGKEEFVNFEIADKTRAVFSTTKSTTQQAALSTQEVKFVTLPLTMTFTGSERKHNLGSFVKKLMNQHNAVEMNIVDDNAKMCWTAASSTTKKDLAAPPIPRRNKSSPQMITAAAVSVALQDIEEEQQVCGTLEPPMNIDGQAATLLQDRRQSFPRPTSANFNPFRRNVETLCPKT
jgi:hypothetical protein